MLIHKMQLSHAFLEYHMGVSGKTGGKSENLGTNTYRLYFSKKRFPGIENFNLRLEAAIGSCLRIHLTF